ncbi:MAG: hypothetical protein IH957_11250 [Chloroflexi bacterium]|nr:hypothetical protein [Chloroflexota bacterium]
MQNPVTDLAHYLGIGELTFGLEPRQRRALLIISVLPALLLLATLTQLGYEIEGSPFEFDSFSNNGLRVYRLSGVIQAPSAAAGLAVMMIAGIGRISRSEGSLCFVGTIVFAGLAILSGIYGLMIYVLIDTSEFQNVRDWYAPIALNFASLAGLVAAGYAFLAFRGLAPRAAE